MQFAGPATSLKRSRIPRVEEGGEGEKKKKKIKPRTDRWQMAVDLLSLKIRRAYRQVTNDKRMQSECGKQILSSVNVATGHQREISRVNGPT